MLIDFRRIVSIAILVLGPAGSFCTAQVLDKQKLLDQQTFWDNRDWEWYKSNIPFFECPDADITTTYYYRWEMLTKHLTYGSANTGYLFTEFIDRPFWSGAYGAISCPAGHQLYEARWLLDSRVAKDYTKYWFRTPGAQPRNYSTWIADAAWSVYQVHPDNALTVELLNDFIKNYEGWEQRHFVPKVGLFWQTGHDDGMEFNITSRQTKDILRGAPSYRPSFNAYMWADAMAIARIANLAGDQKTATLFKGKADALKERVQTLLWDKKRNFFFPMFRDDEVREGHRVQAGTLTYETGEHAGDTHGRELIGFVPWQFDMLDPDKGFEVAWKELLSRDGFYADFGPTTVERHDPMFLLKTSCCWWSGQSWPYATSQTLKAMANLLQRRNQDFVKQSDYVEQLRIFARSHRKNGAPYLAEALHPDTGSFEGHDAYNHSEHYFHSNYCDLVITGLVGLVTRDDNAFEVRPLAPPDWEYFALDEAPYRNHKISVVWDKEGSRYGLGKGLTLLVDGEKVAHADRLEPLSVTLRDKAPKQPTSGSSIANLVVNNDGTYYPHVTASFTSPNTSTDKLNDGNYWYMQHPPNRWTTEGSANSKDWLLFDFGVTRKLEMLKLYFLDDANQGTKILVPKSILIDVWDERKQAYVGLSEIAQGKVGDLNSVRGHCTTNVSLANVSTSKLRVHMEHQPNSASGLTEVEVWGPVTLPMEAVPPPKGNIAYNPNKDGFPKSAASFTDRFGGQPKQAIDGKTNFLPTPMNRWTCYESKSESDWLEVEFEQPTEFRRLELAIYDDRGGVQPPKTYEIQYWDEKAWQPVANATRRPEKPLGSQWNSVSFKPVTSRKVRIVFVHQGAARSGVTEVMVWND